MSNMDEKIIKLKELGFQFKKDGSVERFNAEMFVDKFLSKNKMVYDGNMNYYLYNGKYWEFVAQNGINKKMKEMMDAVAQYMYSPNYAKNIMSFMEMKEIGVEKMNPNPSIIPFEDFNIDFGRGEIVEKSEKNYLTYTKPIKLVEFEEMGTPVFDSFINDIAQGDEDFKRYLLQMMGLILSGQNKLHTIFILYGTGRNSKSVLLKLLEHMLGKEFVESRKMSSFEGQFTLGGLEDKKLITCGEVESSKPISMDVIKSITGGDTIQLEQKYEAIKSCELALNFVFSTNELFKVVGDNIGVKRRLHVIEFAYQVPEDKVDINLLEKLKIEQAGIFRKVLDMYDEMLIRDEKTGEVIDIDFRMSSNVKEFTEKYFETHLVGSERTSAEKTEQVLSYLESYFEIGTQTDRIDKAMFHDVYCRELEDIPTELFWKIATPVLRKKGVVIKKNGKRFLEGIKSKEEFEYLFKEPSIGNSVMFRKQPTVVTYSQEEESYC